MRKHIGILILLLSVLVGAQGSSNRFSVSQDEDRAPNVYEAPDTDIAAEPEVAAAPGPPGDDDLPIDDYIPLLLLIAAGLIAYKTYGRKSLS